MRRILQILGVLTVLGVAIAWLVTGANRGWTKTTVPVKTVDEVTGIEAIHYEDRFLPGLDFLGGAVIAGGLLTGASLFLSPSRKPRNNKNRIQAV